MFSFPDQVSAGARLGSSYRISLPLFLDRRGWLISGSGAGMRISRSHTGHSASFPAALSTAERTALHDGQTTLMNTDQFLFFRLQKPTRPQGYITKREQGDAQSCVVPSPPPHAQADVPNTTAKRMFIHTSVVGPEMGVALLRSCRAAKPLVCTQAGRRPKGAAAINLGLHTFGQEQLGGVTGYARNMVRCLNCDGFLSLPITITESMQIRRTAKSHDDWPGLLPEAIRVVNDKITLFAYRKRIIL